MKKNNKEVIDKVTNAPKAVGPYSLAVKVGNMLFSAGQLGINPETGEIIEGGISAQTRQALINIKNVLGAAGSDLSLVVKTTVFLQDIRDFAAMNDVYAEFFQDNPPARSAIQVAALPKGGLIEIEVIALVPVKESRD